MEAKLQRTLLKNLEPVRAHSVQQQRSQQEEDIDSQGLNGNTRERSSNREESSGNTEEQGSGEKP